MWFTPYIKSTVLLAVFRTLFYQFFLLFVGLTIGFLCNTDYIGWKTNLISQSFNNIFFPVKFDADVCNNLKNWGRFKLYVRNNTPKNFDVIDEAMLGEEIYVLKYSYTDNKGKKQIDIDSIRLRWKPWEYYYELEPAWTDEQAIEYLEKGTLNSRESQRALELLHEKGVMVRQQKQT